MYNLTDPNQKIEFEYIPAAAHVLVVKSLNGVKLNGDAKLLYLKMWKESFFYEGIYGVYKPSNDDLAYSLGVTEKSIRNNIAKLKEAGLVIQLNESRTGGTNSYKMVDWRAVEDITSLKLPKAARQEAMKEKADAEADGNFEQQDSQDTLTDASNIPDVVELPLPIEQVNEPEQASESSPIPATYPKLTDSQIQAYCEMTNQDVELVLNRLESEPSVSGFILEMLEDKATEQRIAERNAQTARNAKAGYEYKGTNPIQQEEPVDDWGGMFN